MGQIAPRRRNAWQQDSRGPAREEWKPSRDVSQREASGSGRPDSLPGVSTLPTSPRAGKLLRCNVGSATADQTDALRIRVNVQVFQPLSTTPDRIPVHLLPTSSLTLLDSSRGVCYFRKDRRLLGKLSQCAADALKTLFRAACKGPRAAPDIIIAIQTYGDLMNFHPHLHALVTDGVFTPTGWFVAFPKIDLYVLEHLFRHRVLQMLLGERRTDEMLPIIAPRIFLNTQPAQTGTGHHPQGVHAFPRRAFCVASASRRR